MPALITHHLFGEDAARRLPDGIVSGEEELLAFLLANQGPDPFFARLLARPQTARACRRLAHAMHGRSVVEALLAAREATAQLPREDARLGRAFSLGLLGHYVLDSVTHPFVYAQQAALVEALPELADSQGELHALIEGDLDSWMLWSQRGLTVADAPATADLARTERVELVGGALFAQVAAQVFGIAIGAGEYGCAVRDYGLAYALIDPAGRRLTAVIARVERLVRGRSRALAQAHRVTTDDECAAANLDCQPWADPATGAISTLSFPDLYFLALDRWPAFAEALARGDGERLGRLAGGRDYDGRLARA